MQKTSLVALYGPRTTVLVALDDGVYEFSYGCTPEGCQLSDGSYEPWICSRHQIKIDEDCKIFAPANLRAAKEVWRVSLALRNDGAISSVLWNVICRRTALTCCV